MAHGLLVIYPMGQIRVCKIRFVGTGKNHGKCKKRISCISDRNFQVMLFSAKSFKITVVGRSRTKHFLTENVDISAYKY